MPICESESPGEPKADHISLGRRSVRGTIWTVIGNGVSQVLLLCSHVVCARLMGRQGYGEFGAVTSTTATMGLLAGLGLSLTATKYISELRVSDPVRAKRILVLAERVTVASGLTMAIVLALLSGYLATAAFAQPSLLRPLQLSGATILFMCLYTFQGAALSAFERFRESSQLSVIRALITLIGMVSGTYFAGVTGAVSGLLAGSVVTCLLGKRMLTRCLIAERMAFPVSGVWREKSIFWSFSLPSLLGGVLASGGAWVLNVILVRTSATFEGMAVLNASRQWLSALTFLPVAIGAGSIPVLSSVTRSLRDKDAVRAALRVPNMLVHISVWPVTLALFLLSPEILRAYGPSYIDGLPTFLWMIGGMAVAYTGYGCSLVVQARGMMWFGFTHQVIYTIASVTTGYFLCRTEGPLGIAIGVAAGSLALLLWMLAILVLRYDFPADLAMKALRDSVLMLVLIILLGRFLPEVPYQIRWLTTALIILAFAWRGGKMPEIRQAISNRFVLLRKRTPLLEN